MNTGDMAMKFKLISSVDKKKLQSFIDSLGIEKETFRGAEQLLRSNSKGYVCLINGEIAGGGYFFIIDKFGPEVGTVAILTKMKYWNHGIAQRILSMLDKLAVECGIKKLRATIDQSNCRSLWVFMKNGYTLMHVYSEGKNYYVEKRVG